MAQIVGSPASENLQGTSDDDVINGLGGDDYIEGMSGADVINGGAGNDWVAFWSSGAGVTIDLATGRGNGGDAEGDLYFNIENIQGSGFDDVLTGDTTTTTIFGGAGNDTIIGGPATLENFRRFHGDDGDDSITSYGSANVRGGQGNDRLNVISTGNIDTEFAVVEYNDSPAAIFANLTATTRSGLAGGNSTDGFRIADGWGTVDTVLNFTTLQDSVFDDVIFVDSTYISPLNYVEIRLGPGNDSVTFENVVGGRVSYRFAEGPVAVDLAAGTATDRFGGTAIGSDTFSGASQARGSRNDDYLSGNDFDNVLVGDAGNDALYGRAGNDRILGGATTGEFSGNDYLNGGAGADILDGGDGFDLAGYDGSPQGVTVNLTTGEASGGDAEGDALVNVEALFGSSFNDVLTSGQVASFDDYYELYGDGGDDALAVFGIGTMFGGAGNDRLIGLSSGQPANADLDFIGASYRIATAGVVANLTAGENSGLGGGNREIGFAVQDGQSGTDRVSGVHQFYDSAFDDIFIVDSNYRISFGSDEVDWVEFRLTTGNDSISADGVTVAGVSYADAGGAVLLDLGAGYATDLTSAFDFVGDDTLSGLNRARGSSFGDVLLGSNGNDHLRGRQGNDRLEGGNGNDTLFGDERSATPWGGDDYLVGARGFDTLYGGLGFDTAEFRGLNGAGNLIINYEGTVYALDRADRSYDTIFEVEAFTDGIQALAFEEIDSYFQSDALAYAASYNDLALALGVNAQAAANHFLNDGFFEGREVTFDASQYLQNHGDLAAAFGTNLDAATRHFLQSGASEGRLAENPLAYIASFNDLMSAFGGRSLEDMQAAGKAHYAGGGGQEGRRTGIEFDAEQYMENQADIKAAFGGNADLATLHFINSGNSEGRLWENPLEYVASFGDLIGAMSGGSESAIRQGGIDHFTNGGFAEGRRGGIDFDADQYLSNYADLRVAFADGNGGYDETEATLHFIRNGYFEGRTDDVLIA
ncbi:MAG: hypothetical protein ACK4R3_02575 [Aliihoeflea sp.]